MKEAMYAEQQRIDGSAVSEAAEMEEKGKRAFE